MRKQPTFEVVITAEAIAGRLVQLFPAGKVTTNDGRAWTVDPAKVVEQTEKHLGGRELPVDFNHQQQHSQDNGQPAPAAGWVKELVAKSDGVWARVEWTKRAQKMLNAKEYRYISPTFYTSRAGHVLHLIGAGLTNTPALDMQALAETEPKREPDPEEGTMKIKELLAAMLGLEPDADEMAMRKKLGVAEDASDEDMMAAAMKMRGAPKADDDDGQEGAQGKAKAEPTAAEPSLKDFVPRAEYDAVAAEVRALRDERTTETAEAAVDAAIAEGKIPPANRAWYLASAKADLDAFAEFAATAPAIITPGGTGEPGKVGAKNGAGLTAEEQRAARDAGLTDEEYAEERKRIEDDSVWEAA